MNNKRRITAGIFVIILILLPCLVKSPYQLHVLIMIGISVLLTSSLRLIFNSGQLSLGHGGMMTLGAYTSALLVLKLGLSSWLALGAGAAISGIFALLVGYPFVRLKGIYFSLVTIFMAEVIRLIAEQWRTLTNGRMGITGIPSPDPIVIEGFLSIRFSTKIEFYYLTLALVVISLLIMYAFEQSRIGYTWLSVRESESLSESVGIDTASYKVLGFCVGSVFAGLAGGLYSQYNTVITPSAFGFIYSMYILVYLIVGGVDKFSGPVIGAFVLMIIPEVARPLKTYQPYIFGGVVILTMFFLPGGLVNLPRRITEIFKE